MAKLYLETKDNIAEIAKQVAANPNTQVVSSDGTPISAQTLAALTSSTPAAPSQADIQAAANYYGVPADVIDKGIVDSYKAELYQADQQAANKALMSSLTPAEKENLAIQNGYQGDYTDTAAIDNYARNVIKTTALAGMTPEQYATDQQRLAVQQAQLVQDEIAKQAANVKASNFAPVGAGTVTDGNKINTQGTGTAGTGTANAGNPWWFGYNDAEDALGAGVNPPTDTGTAGTGTAGTMTPSGLTLADLQKQGYLTNDQLKNALEGQQTALTKQNEKFLTDWGTQADTWKTGVLKDVDTKNQAFGVDATKGFMNAFKNFQIPTNTAGVNMGNYNDNRTTAGDQWWSQYVTGRR